MTDPAAIAQRVIDLAGDRAEAQATVVTGESALTRFANSFIHQNVADTTRVVTVKISLDGKVAKGTDNRSDDAALSDLVDRTIEAARLSPVDPEWAGFAPPAPIPAVDNYDEATAAASPEERAARVKDFIDAGRGTDAAGFCDTEAMTVAFANSLGQQAVGRNTRATIDGIHRVGTVAGSAHQTAQALGDIDGAAAGALAAERFRLASDPYDIKPGEYEVVLSAECVATIAVFLGVYGFNGKAFNEGQSFLEIGKQQFDQSINVWDDPFAPGSLGVGFDGDGTPKRRIDLVRDGVSQTAVHNRKTAAKAGVESTGHGLAGMEAFGAFPANAFVGGGSASVEEMIASVDRGLYVATFNYCRILDPKSQVVTGLTRNGTFMIENGAITGAVTNLRFTQSFVEALGEGRVLHLGDDQRFADSEFGVGLVRAPSMHLSSWNFTGGAEG
ncbi:MAG: TldD/PmbA family protein [Actinobacteria bacterium]|nr:TldD/PmbA family protein [Actinomycetota bacterium]